MRAARTTRAWSVLDVALEGSRIDGFELCRRLRAEHSDVEVVFYTGRRRARPGRAGVRGRRAGRRLQGRLGRPTCSRRCCWPRAGAPTRRRRSPRAPTCATSRTSRPSSSPRCGCWPRAWSARQIAEQMGVGEETVKSHLAEVRRKLGARTSCPGRRDRPDQLAVRAFAQAVRRRAAAAARASSGAHGGYVARSSC